MELSIELDLESGLIIATGTGVLGLNDAKTGAREMWSNPEWSGRPVVWDLRNARLAIEASEVRHLANFVLAGQPSQPPPAVAFVMSRDSDFGLARMFEVFREHPATEVQIFRDYDRAVAWARSVLAR